MIHDAEMVLSRGVKLSDVESGMINVAVPPPAKGYLFCKRLFDLSLSLFFIVVFLSWILPILALLIMHDSRGPVFFFQKRVGRRGKTFTCFKLRTMAIHADKNASLACEQDARITRLGWFLRKSNMDEFPQFFNVLIGDMSLVGPRPHMHVDCDRFASVVPGYSIRHVVKPGLTGLAQVKGAFGPITTRQEIIERWRWDRFYLRKASCLLDLMIVYCTATQRLRFLLHCIT